MQKDNNKVGGNIKQEVPFDAQENTVKKSKKKIFTREKVATELDISVSTLDRLIKKGDARLLPRYFKVGSQYKFTKEAVEEFIENNPYYGDHVQ